MSAWDAACYQDGNVCFRTVLRFQCVVWRLAPYSTKMSVSLAVLEDEEVQQFKNGQHAGS